MAKRRVFVPMDGIDDRRRKADRIMQAIPGLVAYGHLYVHASMKKLIEQMDDYDPKIVEQADDLLDALAMAITAINPALRNTTIDGEFSVVDESAYEDLNFGGCP
jgi:predicted RNase H-like nuclease